MFYFSSNKCLKKIAVNDEEPEALKRKWTTEDSYGDFPLDFLINSYKLLNELIQSSKSVLFKCEIIWKSSRESMVNWKQANRCTTGDDNLILANPDADRLLESHEFNHVKLCDMKNLSRVNLSLKLKSLNYSSLTVGLIHTPVLRLCSCQGSCSVSEFISSLCLLFLVTKRATLFNHSQWLKFCRCLRRW